MRTVNKQSKPVTPTGTPKEEKKRVNPTWEAAIRYQPAFTYVAPEMFE